MAANDAASVNRRSTSRALLAGLRDVLVLLGLTGAAWLLHVYGRVLPTPALAAVWALVAAPIAVGLFRRARIRRRAALEAYLKPASVWSRRLRGGWFMAAREAVLAAALALLLLVALIRLDDPNDWLVLIAAAPVLVALQAALRKGFAAHASAAFLPELVWRAALALTGMAMLAALVLIAFDRAYPDFGGISLERAVWHLVDQERARSGWAEVLLQLAAAKDALRLWVAQQLMPQPGVSFAQGLGWAIVIAEEALFVWSYLVLCSGTLIGVNGNDGRD